MRQRLAHGSLSLSFSAETPDLPFRPSIHDGQFVVRESGLPLLLIATRYDTFPLARLDLQVGSISSF
jgi:hypothetical protein